MFGFKTILIHPLITALVCASGLLICRALNFNPHVNQMVIALGINLMAAELAMVPVYLVRNKPADNAVQGALISTIIHMGFSAIAGLTVLQLFHPPQAFLFWLCAFYWTSLAGVCRVLLRLVKLAPVPVFQPPVSMRQASET